MTNLYSSDVKSLTEDQITVLLKEIEESGVLAYYRYDYDEDSWQFQACGRWSDLLGEQRRRNPPPPQHPSFVIVDEITKRMLRSEALLVFEASPVLYKLR